MCGTWLSLGQRIENTWFKPRYPPDFIRWPRTPSSSTGAYTRTTGIWNYLLLLYVRSSQYILIGATLCRKYTCRGWSLDVMIPTVEPAGESEKFIHYHKNCTRINSKFD